jgi:predicted dehydrogenase
VFSPDNPEQHEALSRIPLMSGKRIYIDKTFATNRAAALRMFELAETYHTPMYSTSALRFAKELETVNTENIAFIDSRGPGTFEIYGIHQFEPLVRLMGVNVKRVMSIGNTVSPSFAIEFTDGRRAVTSHFGWECPFNMAINYDNGKEIGNAALVPDLRSWFTILRQVKFLFRRKRRLRLSR